MIYYSAFYKSACKICRASVCIHMVWSVLCIVLYNEYSALIPYRAVTEVFNKQTHCQVIIRYLRKWRQSALSHSYRMIIYKP